MSGEITDIQKEMLQGKVSRIDKYCDLIVGRRGFAPLLGYEAAMAFAGVRGALGLFLRSKVFPLLLGACGRNVTFGHNVVLRHPHKIRIGSDVIIDDNCLLDAKGTTNRGIDIGSGVFVGRNTILSCKNGDIVLGDKVNIGFNCEVFSASNVTLEASVLVAAYSYFIGGGHGYDDPSVSVLEQERDSKGIQVREGVWVGSGAKILDGVELGAHSIIGAQAVVTGAIAPYAIAVGMPARVVRDRRTPATS